MKKIQCEGKDHILLTEEEYLSLKKDRITIAGYPIELECPFKDCSIINWNDYFNWKTNCGFIFKGCKITIGDLYLIRDISIGEQLKNINIGPRDFKLNGNDIDIKDVSRIIEKVNNSIKIDDSTFREKHQYITHY